MFLLVCLVVVVKLLKGGIFGVIVFALVVTARGRVEVVGNWPFISLFKNPSVKNINKNFN